MTRLHLLWKNEDGAVISAEIMLVATILVIGMIVGLKSVRDSVVSELADVAQAFDNASQSYWYDGANNNRGGMNGSSFDDRQGDDRGHGKHGIQTAAHAFGES